MKLTLFVSRKSHDKYSTLNAATQREVDRIVDDLILTMPVEATDASAWPTSGHHTSDSFKGGSTKRSTKRSSTKRVSAILLLLSLLSFASANNLASSLVDSKLLKAVSQVESGGRDTAKGDHGKAVGRFQFWRNTWRHITSLRAARGLATTSYSDGATHPQWSRVYAFSYLTWIEAELKRRGCRHLTVRHLYAGYNLGVAGFARRGFDLARCPAITRSAATRVEDLCR